MKSMKLSVTRALRAAATRPPPGRSPGLKALVVTVLVPLRELRVEGFDLGLDLDGEHRQPVTPLSAIAVPDRRRRHQHGVRALKLRRHDRACSDHAVVELRAGPDVRAWPDDGPVNPR